MDSYKEKRRGVEGGKDERKGRRRMGGGDGEGGEGEREKRKQK